jgi:hypothetical protein
LTFPNKEGAPLGCATAALILFDATGYESVYIFILLRSLPLVLF